MTTVVSYKCDLCGKISDSKEEMEEHEALHYGLTVPDRKTWTALQSVAKYFCSLAKTDTRDKVQKARTEHLKVLRDFEAEHHLEGYSEYYD